MSIKLQHLDEEKIKIAAAKQFSDCKVRMDKTDLFLKDVEDGSYKGSFHEATFHISTQYAYEDIPVNGNMTRYKMHVHTIELLQDAYSVNYDWKDCYYAVYEKDSDIQFIKYSEFLDFIKNDIHKI